MYGHRNQRRLDDRSRDRSQNEGAPVVIGLLAAAISGLLMGLVTHGAIGSAVIVAMLTLGAGFTGWWLHAAVARGERHTE